jgi:hypothetical protein
MECEQLQEKLRQDAVTIISAVWRGIEWDSVSSRRRMKIYEEYQNKIKSATRIGKLSQFIEKLTEKIDSTISGADMSNILRIIKEVETNDHDLEILDILRSETALLVLMMRDMQGELKNSKQAKQGV